MPPPPLPHSTGQTGTPWESSVFLGSSWGFWSARYCGSNGAGAYQADAVQTGITGFSAEPMGGSDVQYDVVTAYGNVTKSSNYSDSVFIPLTEMGVTVPHYAFYTAQRMADKTRPENVSLPIALYLGRTAQV